MKELCEAYLRSKEAEVNAKAVRIAAEEALIQAIGPSKLEGTETHATDGFKISVTSKLTRKLDFDSYVGLGLDFVDMVPKINLANLRVYEKTNPELVAVCVTSKPAKTSIKVTEVI